MSELLNDLNSKKGVVSPYSFINNINNKFNFEDQQQDSYELFHVLLDLFDKGEGFKSPFHIKIKINYRCTSCGNSFERSEKLLDISLKPNYNSTTLEKMIRDFREKNFITGYNCSKCYVIKMIELLNCNVIKGREVSKSLKLSLFLGSINTKNIELDFGEVKYRVSQFCSENECSDVWENLKIEPTQSDLTKLITIDEFPDILTLHIEKVLFDREIVTSKTYISFQEQLVINKHIYELTSFIEHFGVHDFGHYIAYRKFYNKWIQINDHKVTIIDIKDALRVANPYILFYRKIG